MVFVGVQLKVLTCEPPPNGVLQVYVSFLDIYCKTGMQFGRF